MKKVILHVALLNSITGVSFAQSDSLLPADTSAVIITDSLIAAPRPLQERKSSRMIYQLKPAVDIPVVAAGTAWSLYAFTKIYKKGSIPESTILSLKKSDVNSFDRWGIYPYSKTLDNVSYYPFYASMPLPFIFFLTGEDTRHDFWKLSFLYWEAMSVTGLFGTGGTYFADRYRPYVYTAETPMDKRINQNGKNSFYAGHVQVVATSTFFIAKVYADYHPASDKRWIYYGFASAATGVTAYMRLAGGEHFPSDILLGTTMGVLSGILIPQFHKKNSGSLSLVPYREGEAEGLSLLYQFRNEASRPSASGNK